MFIFGLHASNFDNICDLYVSVIIFGFIELVARVRSWCTVDISVINVISFRNYFYFVVRGDDLIGSLIK